MNYVTDVSWRETLPFVVQETLAFSCDLSHRTRSDRLAAQELMANSVSAEARVLLKV